MTALFSDGKFLHEKRGLTVSNFVTFPNSSLRKSIWFFLGFLGDLEGAGTITPPRSSYMYLQIPPTIILFWNFVNCLKCMFYAWKCMYDYECYKMRSLSLLIWVSAFLSALPQFHEMQAKYGHFWAETGRLLLLYLICGLCLSS